MNTLGLLCLHHFIHLRAFFPQAQHLCANMLQRRPKWNHYLLENPLSLWSLFGPRTWIYSINACFYCRKNSLLALQ